MVDDKPKGTNRQEEPASSVRFRLWPRLQSGAPDVPPGEGLLSPADLGFGVAPSVRRFGENRPATASELTEVERAGHGLGAVYRSNLARAATEANLLTVGGEGSGGSRFLYLDTSQPGIESLVLLPEVWDAARRALGGREPWLALPDRQHCRFLAAGPWRLPIEMAPELATWHREGAEPLFDCLLRREAGRLRAGPRFADLKESAGR
jgi:hypothetical protein